MGFDTTRFEILPEDFLCPICQDVIEYPLQFKICEHIFCTFCITEWSESSSHCPVDNLPVTIPQELGEPSRFFRNQYKKLKIKCKFNAFGCNTIVEIERIMNHELNCPMNPDLEAECGQGCGKKLKKTDRATHNCIIYLRDLISELKNQLNKQNDEIWALRLLPMKDEACGGVKEIVESLKRMGHIKQERVENVLLAVDRNVFFTKKPYNEPSFFRVFNNLMSTAKVLELLNTKLTSNAKVLHIGSDNGYFTLCMAIMVGPSGKVIRLDNAKEFVDQANEKLRDHFPLLKDSQIKFVIGDGRTGYRSDGPYDVINYGFPIDEVPQIVIDQLKPNGRIVAPIPHGSNSWNQVLTTIDKSADGVTSKQEHGVVYFSNTNYEKNKQF